MCSTVRAKVGAIQVAEPNRVRAADLVAVTGPDAAAGGADVLAVGGALVERFVLGEVPGKDHVGPVADPQILVGHVALAAGRELVELFDHAGRIEHHAAGDHAGDARREDAARQQRELVDLVADDDRVPGVRPALVADDEIVLAWSAGRRSCPWLRHPIADRLRKFQARKGPHGGARGQAPAGKAIKRHASLTDRF